MDLENKKNHPLRKISKRLSFYLRHHPEKIGMELDEDGFSTITINELARRMGITRDTILKIVEKDEKGRFTIKDGRIRANYGHSHPVGRKMWESIAPTPQEKLPSILYHGTRLRFWNKIKHQGLISKSRQFVHLSTTLDWAFQVGRRMVQKPVILAIDVNCALKHGVKFWVVSQSTVLATEVPPNCISVVVDGNTKKE